MIPLNMCMGARDKHPSIVGSAGLGMQHRDRVYPVCIESGIARAVRWR